MPKIENVRVLKEQLRKLAKKYGSERRPSVVVGYTQSYALAVHETDRNYQVGQWKYLSIPANNLRKELARIVREALKAGIIMPLALLRAGLRLQAESQELVPIDTSALRASAFTANAADMQGIARAIHSISEEVRKRATQNRT